MLSAIPYMYPNRQQQQNSLPPLLPSSQQLQGLSPSDLQRFHPSNPGIYSTQIQPALSGSADSSVDTAYQYGPYNVPLPQYFYQQPIPQPSNIHEFQSQSQSKQQQTETQQQQQDHDYSTIDLIKQIKRKRRKFHEVERLYKCNYNHCNKSYGTLNHLNSHVLLQKHGKKRLPDEFKALREDLKMRKKMEKERQQQQQQQKYFSDYESQNTNMALNNRNISSLEQHQQQQQQQQQQHQQQQIQQKVHYFIPPYHSPQILPPNNVPRGWSYPNESVSPDLNPHYTQPYMQPQQLNLPQPHFQAQIPMQQPPPPPLSRCGGYPVHVSAPHYSFVSNTPISIPDAAATPSYSVSSGSQRPMSRSISTVPADSPCSSTNYSRSYIPSPTDIYKKQYPIGHFQLHSHSIPNRHFVQPTPMKPMQSTVFPLQPPLTLPVAPPPPPTSCDQSLTSSSLSIDIDCDTNNNNNNNSNNNADDDNTNHDDSKANNSTKSKNNDNNNQTPYPKKYDTIRSHRETNTDAALAASSPPPSNVKKPSDGLKILELLSKPAGSTSETELESNN